MARSRTLLKNRITKVSSPLLLKNDEPRDLGFSRKAKEKIRKNLCLKFKSCIYINFLRKPGEKSLGIPIGLFFSPLAAPNGSIPSSGKAASSKLMALASFFSGLAEGKKRP